MMPRRKVEVFPKESRGVPEGKSRCSRRKVEVFPNAPFLGLPNAEAIFTLRLPPVRGGVRVGGMAVLMRKSRHPAISPGPAWIRQAFGLLCRWTTGQPHGGYASVGRGGIIFGTPGPGLDNR
jgi:hypothetical protein